MHIWMDRYMTSILPGAQEVVVPSAAHLVHEDRPDEVVKAIVEFLKVA